MKKLLVTGGAGFIGSNFVRYWRSTYPQDVVVVLDALTYAGNRANLAGIEEAGKFRFVHGNILDQALVEDLLRSYELDTVVHFAAESHVDRSILGPDAFIETNIVGTHSLLKAARAVWLEEWKGKRDVRFHHVSTDEVYGTLGPTDPAFTEKTPYAPNSPYAASKAASDHLVRAYMETYGLPVTISNCSNNYGPYHFPEKLIPLVITNILDDRPLPVYGDGLQIRDWLHVEDHCRGIDLILKSDRVGECFNIGGNNEWANIDIVKQACRLMNEAMQEERYREAFPNALSALRGKSEDLITFVTDRPGHDRRYAIDATKSESVLGFAPNETFASGIAKTIRWYLENEKWWREVQNGDYRQWMAAQYNL
ncbi:MAG: dTDP-glucose 4,6-dehydratase [Desulfomicrobium sp.]|nr:dTDP-glucose 4,6-dehydratase [Pseudomonadota bacterium]MBV1713010.1 dTDP-glucose 4,6-dehydratase [Desulfomicrobium sp.]MBU4571980.1 dTDP-glucose 4,6-dehydratase [Pseudomonadota bacterium]MBU4596129.1 dTDP-glucose 4,6-dehydratase [Pseudomonadota bacterium]MBV1721433.1 dTDP-glucose 4,6-dehydratase [Desulfomicrobium sp.]